MMSSTAKVAILTDSVAQVPADLADQLRITIIPYIVTIEGKSYLDGCDLQPADLYRRMRLEKVIPTTSAPSPATYVEAFTSLIESGSRAILCITLSSKLSSAYNTACLAAEQVRLSYPTCTIDIFDSKTATLSEGFIALAAARAAAQGKSASQVREVAKGACQATGLVATLDTLEYLARGGRIGRLAYLAASLVKIHPVLKIDTDGMLSAIARVRTEMQARQIMVEQVASLKLGRNRLHLAILEADAPDQAAELRDLAVKQLHPDQIYHSQLTPVMGAHTGPGVTGLSFYFE